MKKITLSVALLAAVLTAKSQDTLCTYFTGDRVIEFDYKTNKILHDLLSYYQLQKIISPPEEYKVRQL